MNSETYFEAIRDGDVDRLRRLLSDEPGLVRATTRSPFDPEGPADCTGLHAAVHAGKPEVARALLDAGADLEARTQGGRTALHESIELGQDEISRLLIEHGAEVDVCSAAILGLLGRLRQLLDADPSLANDRSTGLSPLGWAAFGNQVAAATELIERGARMDDGELLCAASVGHVEVGRLLIARGADPDAIPEGCDGNALHAAAAMKYTGDSRRFIDMLLAAGADVNARTAGGKTALDVAEELGRQQAASTEPGECRHRYDAVAALLRRRGGVRSAARGA